MSQSIYVVSKKFNPPDNPIKPQHNINDILNDLSLKEYESDLSERGGIEIITHLSRPELMYRLFWSIRNEGELRVVCRYLAHYTKGLNVPNLYVIIAELFTIVEERLADNLVDGGVVDEIIADKLDVLFPGSPEDKKSNREEDEINEKYEQYTLAKEAYKDVKTIRSKVNKFINKHSDFL